MRLVTGSGRATAIALSHRGADFFLDGEFDFRGILFGKTAEFNKFASCGQQGVLASPLLHLLGRHVVTLVVGGVSAQAKAHALDQHGHRRRLHRFECVAKWSSRRAKRRCHRWFGLKCRNCVPDPTVFRNGIAVWSASRTSSDCFWSRKMTGAFRTEARFMASWISPVLLPPSPMTANPKASSPALLAAHVPPTTRLGIPSQVANHRKTPFGGVAVMRVAFASMRWAVGVCDILAKQLMRSRTEQQMPGEIAMQQRHHVAAWSQRHGHANRGCLVAGADRHGCLWHSLFGKVRADGLPNVAKEASTDKRRRRTPTATSVWDSAAPRPRRVRTKSKRRTVVPSGASTVRASCPRSAGRSQREVILARTS